MNNWSGFYKKTRDERLNVIKNANILDNEHFNLVNDNKLLDFETANNMVENVYHLALFLILLLIKKVI